MRKSLAAVLAMVVGCGVAVGEGSGVLGVWHSKDGAKIDVHSCGSEVCVKLVKLSDDAPGTNDANNPDQSLRQRPLVGLEIGQGFRLADAAHAENGKLYDPKSGKTYHGTMSSDGDALNLRGYVGIKAFGRSETWMRDK